MLLFEQIVYSVHRSLAGAAPWLFAAAAILVVGGFVAACWEHGLLRKDFAAFRRLSAFRRCVLTAFVVLAAYSAGTKGDGGRSNGAADAPRMMARPVLATPDADEDEIPVAEMFPVWTNAVTNLCVTGIRTASTADYLRAHWPLPLTPGATGIEVYARPRLETDGWACIGEFSIPPGTNSTVVAVPHALLPFGWEHSMFYLLGFDFDTDGDTLTDLYELLVSKTDPFLADTDGDGIPDGEEVELGSNALSAHSDDDGLSDGEEVGKIELMPQESVRWRTFYNAHNVWPMPTVGVVGFATITLPCPYTVNGITFRKARVILDGVIDLLDPSHEEYGVVPSFLSPPDLAEFAMSQFHVAIAAFCDNLRFDGVHHGSCAWYGTIELPSGPASIIEFDDCYFADGQNLDDFDAISFQVILPSNEPNVVYLTYSPMYPCADFASRNVTIGVQCPILMLDPVHEGEEYYNLTWKPTAEFFGGWRTLKVTIGRGTDPSSSDTDGDGFADDLEISLGSDPTTADGDTDSDGLPDAVELLIGTDPANADTDYDGLEDFEEYTLGTDPLQPDTDGDGLDDGWEMRYDGEIVVSPRPAGLLMMAEPGTAVPFDPTVNNDEDEDPNNDSDEDPDDDGLTNSEECAAGTNPCVPDPDGDGVNDQDEVGQGSDPTDPTDEGDSSSREAVSFYFGDHSDSHSEKYRLEVKPLQGVGARPQTFSKINEKYGQCETRTVYLKPGWSYEVRLFHSGTKPGESVDYDYTLQFLGDLPANVFVVDEDTLFGRHDTDATGRPYAGDGKVARVYVLGDPRLVPDYDRDGKIDDADAAKAKEGKVFRFWINDDNDDEDKQENDSANDIPGSGPNHSNGHVDGRCDLLDFTPILLDVNSVVACVPESMRSAFLFRLRQQDEALNVVWTSLDADRAGAFQTNDCGQVFGSTLSAAIESAQTERIEDDGTSVSDTFAEVLCADGGRGVVLVEGRQSTTNSLWLEVMCAGKVVCSNALPCVISSVEEMYRLASLRDAVEDPAFRAVVPSTPTNQPPCTNDLDVFFLHGFNVDAQAARAWGAEIFKRLWQSGSNARFHILPWHGDYSWSPGNLFNGLHYQHNVWYAQRTAGALKRYIETAQPVAAKRVLMTQSLGNMVACEALREELQVAKYFMFDAAIPSESIDRTLRAESESNEPYLKYVRAEWRDYTNACWASNWHRLFTDNPNDSRAQMGWANRFQNALTNATEVFNYYSSGDSVFTEQESIPSLMSDVHANWGLNWFLWIFPYPTVSPTFENHCWQKQEVLKGMATPAGTLSGGWGFNVWQEYDERAQKWKSVCYSPAGAVAAIADGSITNRPAFDVSDAEEMLDSNATDDDVFLALAKHVPALSSPVGGTNVVADCISGNVNMNLNNAEGGVFRPNGWGRMHNNYGVSWLHSDMKDMAFFYVFKLYDQLITKGNLR